MGCNLTCNFCDSQFTWNAQRFDLHVEGKRTPVPEIVARATVGNPQLVVVTGGEPLLHQGQDGWEPLLAGLSARAEVEIETNGTVTPTNTTLLYVSRLNVSPKLAHGGDPFSARIKPEVLHALIGTGRAAFKFVVKSVADLDEAGAVVREAGIPDHQVWIMPEGVNAQAIIDGLACIADEVVSRGWNLTARLHILAYGDKRGV